MPTVDEALNCMRRFSTEHEMIEAQIPALEADQAKRSWRTEKNWSDAIIAVGKGYGFVVQGAYDRFVISAAHCLPELPPCNVGQHDKESLYPALLGPPGGPQTVAAACYYAEPISDVAVLGAPNGIEAPDEFDQFLRLTDAATPLWIAEPPLARLGWLPSSDGGWSSYVVRSAWGQLLIVGLDEILLEMSGAPIISDDGMAIGVLCPNPDRKFLGGAHPGLASSLPGRLLRILGVTAASSGEASPHRPF
jgi:hypothetical protein